ncbi:MAG: hypothetical protein OEV52_06185 [Dehalococcoidia bacterium]|jgi:uncharacterized membrane protein YjfL (UPF0719 family)|nr:hypothetical protein [Dehalococcoidia bacterium]
MSVSEIGPATPFYVIVLLWIARVIIWTFICGLLAWLGIRALDALTRLIHERERIGESPISVGLFIAGFFILIGLVIHGVVTGPVLVGGGLLASLIDPRRLGLVAVTFLVALLLGVALLHIVDKLTPKIPFLSVEQNPVAVGIYVFGYLVFFGLIIHGALIMPL